ncbi:SusC/RagA family TonB-linked outer membrane protein [Pontibacter chinhatensis]|uniref:TonB-linked outer membrane protein, SusC/RagA family n=1 Tax=Pontibacter chinhatensis TaxID=1436961 RepID=A0A1I2RJ48_9BACT|nr:TonB-dependent receptor [Pontibacter chinhatensis]SFG40542.1 TonB-linked outer membrane protein, SusC/RagA family [Pontibacter chinhatensis]
MRKTFTQRWRKGFAILFLCFSASAAHSRDTETILSPEIILPEWVMSGKVVSSNGEALPGVTVVLKGTSLGTSTDAGGNYTLSVPDKPGTLVFSFIGMVTQEVPVNGPGTINVTLADDAKALEEVVVIGYGTVKKSSVTAAVTKVENTKLDQIPAGRPEAALAGRLAGVNITQNRSIPGAAPIIRVRGAGSISAGNDPLVVIDGFPGGNLESINMNDVESIEVLKDASSAAIYGSRGAGGVIIVTTKKGRSGKPKLNFNAYTGFSKAMGHDDWISGQEYYDYVVRYQNREFVWAGGDPSIPVWGDDRRPAQYQVHPAIKENNINWQDEVLRTAPMQNYNLSVSGGTDNVKYYVSGGYKNEQGTLLNTWYKNYSVRANVDVKVNSAVNVGFNINPSFSNRRYSPLDINPLVKYPPFVAKQNPDGTYPKARDYWGVVVTGGVNPLAILNGSSYYSTTMNNIGEAYVGLKLLEGLNFKSSVGTNISYNTAENFQASYASNAGVSSGSSADARNINLVNENVLSYDKTFRDVHSLSGIAGASYQKYTNRFATIGAVAGSYNNDIIETLNNAIVNAGATSTSKSQWGLVSYFTRLQYGFKDKYLFSGSIRTDGSSRFGPNNKWGYFPSASVAWRVSEENFMDAIPAISNLKLRASYGATGNFNIGDFDYLGRVGSVNYSPNNQLAKGQAQVSFGNPELKWERTNSYDVGVELGLFDNRLNLVVDYYDKRTTDLLYFVGIPGITGFNDAISNIGEIKNHGFEVELSTKNLVGAFTWETDFNLARNKNEVVSLGGVDERIFTDTYGMSWILKVGEPMFSYYGYRAIGVLQNAEDVANSPIRAGSKPGNTKFADVDGDGEITPEDRVILGNFQPKMILGMVNNFAWKNFDLSIAMQASLGAKMYNFENEYYQGALAGAMRRSLVETQWWSEAEPGDGKMPASALSMLTYQTSADVYIEDASFLTIRNLNLGYTLPSSITDKLRMNNLRLYTSVSNLLMLTKKGFHGYNPEGFTAGEIGGVNSRPGFNNGSEPVNRVVTFGVNLSF